MEQARPVVGHADTERALRRLSQPNCFRFVLDPLGKPAELAEAYHHPGAIEDRDWQGLSKMLVDPIGGQRGEVVGRELDHPLVLTAEIVRLLEIARGENT